MSSYSEYNSSKEGLKIELLYRKVGWKVWYKAFNSTGKATVLLQIKQNDIVSVCYVHKLLVDDHHLSHL
jgi:hypothetical protein